MPFDSNTPVLYLEKLYSMEFYENTINERKREQVLKNINFSAGVGEIWAILGFSVFEIRLLLEIMANSKAYEKGIMMVSGTDTSRRKRVILQDIFYIGSTNMAFGNMNVLEYLMFITSRKRKPAVDRQEALLEFLLEAELGYICLTPIGKLTVEEKSILILIAAVLSDSRLIIMNLPRLQYDSKQIASIKKVTQRLIKHGKTLVFSSQCYALSQSICTNICYVYKGQVIYMSELSEFLNKYDRVIYTINADNSTGMNNSYIQDILRLVLPDFEYCIENEAVNIIDNGKNQNAYQRLYKAFINYNLNPVLIRKNTKNLTNAISGLMKTHDIR